MLCWLQLFVGTSGRSLMFWVVGWCQWYGYLVLLKGRGGVGEGGLGDSQIQPKKEAHRHESTWYNEEK